MAQFKIGVCEFSFPCRGPIAIGMAGEAGFDGVQIADCMGSDEGYPLHNPYVQDCYLKACEEHKVELQAMHLQRLMTQRFLKKSPKSNLKSVSSTISFIGGTNEASARDANGFVFRKIASPAQYTMDATSIPPRTEALIPFSFRKMMTNSPTNIVTTVSTIVVYPLPICSLPREGVRAPKKSRSA